MELTLESLGLAPPKPQAKPHPGIEQAAEPVVTPDVPPHESPDWRGTDAEPYRVGSGPAWRMEMMDRLPRSVREALHETNHGAGWLSHNSVANYKRPSKKPLMGWTQFIAFAQLSPSKAIAMVKAEDARTGQRQVETGVLNARKGVNLEDLGL